MLSYAQIRRLVLTILLMAASMAAVAAEKPAGDFLAAGLAAQETICGSSLRARWTESMASAPKVGQLRVEVLYIRTKGVLYKEERRFRMNESKEFKPEFTVRRRYDRTSGAYRETVSSADGKLLRAAMLTSTDIPSRFTGTPVIDPALFTLMDKRVSRLMVDGSVGSVQEDVDGSACWRVEVSEKQISKQLSQRYTVWTDPRIGFCPRRLVEYSTRDGKTRSCTWDFRRYTQLGEGAFFPRVVTKAWDDPKMEGLRIEVASSECGVQVPESEVAVDIPAGTEVQVLPEGVFVKAP